MEWFEYTLTGQDGIDLLQRISASEFRFKETSEIYQDGLILNPQGKIAAYFRYRFTARDSLSILVPSSADDLARTSFLSAIDQYTFAEKYTLTFVAGRTLSENESERILARRPRIDFEFKTDSKTSPLDINLGNALADQKGCYPGQEVIEKIISIGQAPKKLCVVSIADGGVRGEALFDGESEVGIITSLDGAAGLAILRKTHAKQNQILKTKLGISIGVTSA